MHSFVGRQISLVVSCPLGRPLSRGMPSTPKNMNADIRQMDLPTSSHVSLYMMLFCPLSDSHCSRARRFITASESLKWDVSQDAADLSGKVHLITGSNSGIGFEERNTNPHASTHTHLCLLRSVFSALSFCALS